MGNDNLDYNLHNKYVDAYVRILDSYNEQQIGNTIETTNQLKKEFFIIIIVIMSIVILLFVACVLCSLYIFYLIIDKQYESITVIIGAITSIITTFSTLIISIKELPLLMGMYLFNKDENKSMSEIIKNIQLYEIESARVSKDGSYRSQEVIKGEEKDSNLQRGQGQNESPRDKNNEQESQNENAELS